MARGSLPSGEGGSQPVALSSQLGGGAPARGYLPSAGGGPRNPRLSAPSWGGERRPEALCPEPEEASEVMPPLFLTYIHL